MPAADQALLQTLSNELLKAKVGLHQTPLLSVDSNGREVVEDTKAKLLQVIKRRWLQMRPVGAFDGLEEWALREISEGKATVHVLKDDDAVHLLYDAFFLMQPSKFHKRNC